MNITATLDATRFNRKLESLHDALIGAGQDGDAATIIADESRRWLKQVIKFTPPKNQGQGRQAVARDIARAATPLTADKFKNPKLRERFREMTEDESWSHSSEAIQEFLRDAGWKKAKVLPFSPQLHKSVRDRRGRVQSSKNVFILEVDKWNKYVREVQRFVGWMKSGWNPAYSALGGKLARWITRHGKDRRAGFVVNRLSGERPSITIGNVARGVGQIRPAAESALLARAEAIKRRIRLILSGYSKDLAQGMRAKRRAKPTPETFHAE